MNYVRVLRVFQMTLFASSYPIIHHFFICCTFTRTVLEEINEIDNISKHLKVICDKEKKDIDLQIGN